MLKVVLISNPKIEMVHMIKDWDFQFLEQAVLVANNTLRTRLIYILLQNREPLNSELTEASLCYMFIISIIIFHSSSFPTLHKRF